MFDTAINNPYFTNIVRIDEVFISIDSQVKVRKIQVGLYLVQWLIYGVLADMWFMSIKFLYISTCCNSYLLTSPCLIDRLDLR